MEELKDIQGLDQISAWPLAIGWWLIIGVVALALVGTAILLFRRYRYRQSWQFTSFVKLHSLEAELNNQQPKKIAQDLSEELKRIAMQTRSREACAGLVGNNWLQWLQEHDPKKFAWQTQGQLLIQYQYMPAVAEHNVVQLKTLITAAKAWVKKC